jgi:hypothetical protein
VGLIALNRNELSLCWIKHGYLSAVSWQGSHFDLRRLEFAKQLI